MCLRQNMIRKNLARRLRCVFRSAISLYRFTPRQSRTGGQSHQRVRQPRCTASSTRSGQRIVAGRTLGRASPTRSESFRPRFQTKSVTNRNRRVQNVVRQDQRLHRVARVFHRTLWLRSVAASTRSVSGRSGIGEIDPEFSGDLYERRKRRPVATAPRTQQHSYREAVCTGTSSHGSVATSKRR